MRTDQQPQRPKACWPPCHQNPQKKESFPGHLVLVARLLFTMPTYANKIQQGHWTLVGTIMQRSFSQRFVPCCHHVIHPFITTTYKNLHLRQVSGGVGTLASSSLANSLASSVTRRLLWGASMHLASWKIYRSQSPLRPRRRLKSMIRCFCLF